MTDKAYIENIKNISNEELINDLEEYGGRDPYYRDLWYCVLNEVKRRLNLTEDKK